MRSREEDPVAERPEDIARGGRTAVAPPSASLAVYASAAGIVGFVPLPLVDELLGDLARGSAMRRVAARHNVSLLPEARELLSKPISRPRKNGRLLRSIVSRLAAPLRIVSRVEDGATAFASARLLDHYLATSERRLGSAIHLEEAKEIRNAMQRALGETVVRAVRDAPASFFRVVADVARGVTKEDDERRTILERMMDTLLDAAAEAPPNVGDELVGRFEEALAARGQR